MELWNTHLWHRGMKKVTAALQTELLCQIEIIYLHFLAELCSSPGVWAAKLEEQIKVDSSVLGQFQASCGPPGRAQAVLAVLPIICMLCEHGAELLLGLPVWDVERSALGMRWWMPWAHRFMGKSTGRFKSCCWPGTEPPGPVRVNPSKAVPIPAQARAEPVSVYGCLVSVDLLLGVSWSFPELNILALSSIPELFN